MIRFKIDLVAHSPVLKCGRRPGVRDHGEGEHHPIVIAPGHRETDAIHGNTRLVADVATKVGLQPTQLQFPGSGSRLNRDHLTDRVDMATDEMAPKSIAQPQGWLQVHAAAAIGFDAKRGASEGFLTDIRQKTVTAEVSHGETDPIHRNAVPERKRCERAAPINQNGR